MNCTHHLLPTFKSGGRSEYEVEMKQTDQGEASLSPLNVVNHSGYIGSSWTKSPDQACSVHASSTSHLSSSPNLKTSGQASHLSVSGQASSPAHQSNKLEADSVLIISTGDLFASTALVCHAGSTTPVSKELTPLSQDQFNWRVLLMPKFLLVGFSIAAFGLGVCVVFSALPPLSKELGQ